MTTTLPRPETLEAALARLGRLEHAVHFSVNSTVGDAMGTLDDHLEQLREQYGQGLILIGTESFGSSSAIGTGQNRVVLSVEVRFVAAADAREFVAITRAFRLKADWRQTLLSEARERGVWPADDIPADESLAEEPVLVGFRSPAAA